MSIPESQLVTWSHQGAIAGSRDTYASIKNALEVSDSPFAGKDYEVFLQGSYGNDTNIYAESDVDVVIKINDCFFHDLTNLSSDQQDLFESSHSAATYTYPAFRQDVHTVLTTAYPGLVYDGDKAIHILPTGNRRSADVVAAAQFRRYHRFRSLYDQTYDEGICFFRKDGTRIVNYPKQHSANCTAKHQATLNRFKPMVRVLKNLRGRLIEKGMLDEGTAPSYFLEGLLYNAPSSNFALTYSSSFVQCVNSILGADRSSFLCANEQYYLLWEDSPVAWPTSHCDQFLAAAVKLWEEWT